MSLTFKIFDSECIILLKLWFQILYLLIFVWVSQKNLFSASEILNSDELGAEALQQPLVTM